MLRSPLHSLFQEHLNQLNAVPLSEERETGESKSFVVLLAETVGLASLKLTM